MSVFTMPNLNLKVIAMVPVFYVSDRNLVSLLPNLPLEQQRASRPEEINAAKRLDCTIPLSAMKEYEESRTSSP